MIEEQIKRIRRPYSAYIPSVILYYDDIQKIVDILKEIGQDVVIFTDEYEVTSLSTLLSSSNQQVLDYIKITLISPKVSIEIEPQGVRLYIDEDEPAQRGTLEQIKDILIIRKRKWPYTPPIILFFNLVGILVAILMVVNLILRLEYGILYSGILLVIFYIVFSIQNGPLKGRKKQSLIYLKRKDEMPSFWERQKDEIIIALVSGSIAAVLSAIATWFFTR